MLTPSLTTILGVDRWTAGREVVGINELKGITPEEVDGAGPAEQSFLSAGELESTERSTFQRAHRTDLADEGCGAMFPPQSVGAHANPRGLFGLIGRLGNSKRVGV